MILVMNFSKLDYQFGKIIYMYKAKEYKNITLNNYHKMLISSTG